jgi:hypothetical protein
MTTVELWMLFFFFGYFPNPISSLCFLVPPAATFIHKLSSYLYAVLRIRMFLGLPDPHSDPFVTSTDLALDPATATDPSIIKQNSKKKRKILISTFCDFFMIFLSLKNDVNALVVRIRIQSWIRIRIFLGLPDPDPHLDPDPYISGPPESHLDSLVRGTDLRIRIRIQIRINMSRIRNTAYRLMTFSNRALFISKTLQLIA